jgi:plastocyanin
MNMGILPLIAFILHSKIFVMILTYSLKRFPEIFAALAFIMMTVAANATTHIITAQDFSFTPSSVTANLGDTIEWDWVSGNHTTTSTTIPAGAAGWSHSLNSQDGNNSFIYVPTVTGTYNYKCNIHPTQMTGSFTVSSCSPPTAEQAAITAGGPTTFCKGKNVVLTVATSGLTYQWKKGNVIQSGATQQNFMAKKTGNYTCDVSNACGTTTSNSISVTVNATPTASVSAAPCSGGAELLTCTFMPGNGVTFKWKKGSSTISGATNSTFSATSSGTYKCIVTIAATGCSKTSNGVGVTINCKLGEAANDNKVIVYPNPSSDYFNMNTSPLDEQSVIYIYDLTGRLIESHQVANGEMKIGEGLSNGVYLLSIALNNKTHQIIKLVKNF